MNVHAWIRKISIFRLLLVAITIITMEKALSKLGDAANLLI
ncbi:hypothetical protein PPECC9_42290 [Escherichia coli PCN009]|nr:hypothetical protein PPECC9_42290 [Escherichia coli PCN009]